MSKLLQKTVIDDQGVITLDNLGELLNDDLSQESFRQIARMLIAEIGRLRLDVNALQSRCPDYLAGRWQTEAGYIPVLNVGAWTPVRFGKENIHGDYTYLTNTDTIFRCQIPGNYRVTAVLNFNALQWYESWLGVFKNGVFWSRIRGKQDRVNDLGDGQWDYFDLIDLAGASDIINLKEGDEVDIRVYFTAAETGGGITKCSGFVNFNYVGNNGTIINNPADTWL